MEQELAEKKQALELSLLRTRQENELANAKKSNDELVRVVGTIHGIDPVSYASASLQWHFKTFVFFASSLRFFLFYCV